MKRHAFDITAFVWGVLFLAVALVATLNQYGNVDLDLRWLLPAGLITAGIGGIANAIRNSQR